MKVCIECKHCDPHLQPGIASFHQKERPSPSCKHPDAATRNMVTGECLCINERNKRQGCGKEGKLWQAK